MEVMSDKVRRLIPNLITGIRIALSCCLLLIAPEGNVFVIVYILCGMTDVLDGYFARKWEVTSRFGALFDSIADVIFVVVILIIFIPVIEWQSWMLGILGLIVVIRCASVLVGMIRFHEIAFIHTYGNKAAGLALFCFPFLYQVISLPVVVGIVCGVACVSALEELVIMVTSPELNRDRKWMKEEK